MTTQQFLDEILKIQSEKFRNYLEMGKEMDKRHMLSWFVDMYIDYCGVSRGYRTVVYDLGWAVFIQYTENEHTEFTGKEAFCDVMKKLNPGYTEEYDKYDICLLDKEDYLPLCMEILDEYAGHDEKCAALCYGLHCYMK